MGTRPEAVKLAPVVAALRGANDFRCTVVATGQHKEMFRQVAETFGFAVDADLDVMRPNQTLAGLTARLMDGIDGWLGSAQPDMALVQGDTTTVLVASLACFYRRIPIGHVEAGLRTGNIWSPFPEEVNRRLATPLVALHFAPTEAARAALLREAVPEETISVTGNTVIDALRIEVATQAERRGAARSHRRGAEPRCWAPTGRKCPWSSSPGTAARTSATASSRSARPSPRWPSASRTTVSSIRFTSTPTCWCTSTGCWAACRTSGSSRLRATATSWRSWRVAGWC